MNGDAPAVRPLMEVLREEEQHHLANRAIEQIRASLITLGFADNGYYEDEAQVALDALDWIEGHVFIQG